AGENGAALIGDSSGDRAELRAVGDERRRAHEEHQKKEKGTTHTPSCQSRICVSADFGIIAGRPRPSDRIDLPDGRGGPRRWRRLCRARLRRAAVIRHGAAVPYTCSLPEISERYLSAGRSLRLLSFSRGV